MASLVRLVLLVWLQSSTAFRSLLTTPRPSRLTSRALANDPVQWVQGLEKDTRAVISLREGRCRASAPVKRGEALIAVPSGVVLDASKFNSKYGSGISSSSLRTGDLGILALLLLCERNSKESKWDTYLAELPPSPPGILAWTKSELEELYSSTTRNIAAQVEAIESDYEVVRKQRLPVLPELSLEEFKWAMGVVKSKVLYLENKPCLIPGLDSIAFDPFSSAEPFIANAGVFGAKVVKVLADRNYNSGDEVFISYGLKSSAECLEDHGIVPLLELADACAEISVAIESTDKFSDDKENVLENAGYGIRLRFDLEAEVEVDPLLLQFLRLKLIEGKDAFILEACFKDTIWQTLTLPFSKPNEIKVLTYIADTCKNALDKINSASSEANDDTFLKEHDIENPSSETERRKLLMAELRQQERAALKGTLAYVSEELRTLEGQGLDTREYYQERRLRELNLLRPLEESEIIMPGDRPPLDDDY